jgi:hypothetical protein
VSDVKALVVTGGHPFDRDAFAVMLSALDGVASEWVRHPEAQTRFRPGLDADVVVLYDMPGIAMGDDRRLRFSSPPTDVIAGWRALLEAGQPFVFIHHALAGWPTWAEYADVVGGRFLYEPGELMGRRWPESGFRHEVKQRIEPVDPVHPICAGLENGFELVDEIFLCPVYTDEITPVFTSDATFADPDFHSALHATVDPHDDSYFAASRPVLRPDGLSTWHHPPGNDAVVWTKRSQNSPVAFVQPGHRAETLSAPQYQRLVTNAIRWAADA